mmetsp:Transcript_19970/g.53794  ORF Transcript_19970/g.53794 Transcript_19970/m.53794 type:complete len:257 (+) Transcript_19970:433-1203(+)
MVLCGVARDEVAAEEGVQEAHVHLCAPGRHVIAPHVRCERECVGGELLCALDLGEGEERAAPALWGGRRSVGEVGSVSRRRRAAEALGEAGEVGCEHPRDGRDWSRARCGCLGWHLGHRCKARGRGSGGACGTSGCARLAAGVVVVDPLEAGGGFILLLVFLAFAFVLLVAPVLLRVLLRVPLRARTRRAWRAAFGLAGWRCAPKGHTERQCARRRSLAAARGLHEEHPRVEAKLVREHGEHRVEQEQSGEHQARR